MLTNHLKFSFQFHHLGPGSPTPRRVPVRVHGLLGTGTYSRSWAAASESDFTHITAWALHPVRPPPHSHRTWKNCLPQTSLWYQKGWAAALGIKSIGDAPFRERVLHYCLWDLLNQWHSCFEVNALFYLL